MYFTFAPYLLESSNVKPSPLGYRFVNNPSEPNPNQAILSSRPPLGVSWNINRFYFPTMFDFVVESAEKIEGNWIQPFTFEMFVDSHLAYANSYEPELFVQPGTVEGIANMVIQDDLFSPIPITTTSIITMQFAGNFNRTVKEATTRALLYIGYEAFPGEAPEFRPARALPSFAYSIG